VRRRSLATSFSLLLLTLASAAVLSSCYFTRSPSRPLPALAFRNPRLADARCLVVFLPGFLDTPDSYRDNDFPRDLIASGAGCDAVGVDLHFRYYGSVGVADMVYEDVLQPAIARGYDEIWLVGISMGGMGTLLTASQYAEHIDGIVLIAPFVGEEPVLCPSVHPGLPSRAGALGGHGRLHFPESLDRDRVDIRAALDMIKDCSQRVRGRHARPECADAIQERALLLAA